MSTPFGASARREDDPRRAAEVYTPSEVHTVTAVVLPRLQFVPSSFVGSASYSNLRPGQFPDSPTSFKAP